MSLALLATSLIFRGPSPASSKPLILAHYMPWFAAPPVSKEWGWHWTMGKLDPSQSVGGRQQAASHYRPLIGLYDSGDPLAVECQVQLMKLAGIDGLLADWYGTIDHYDYAVNNRNTLLAFQKAKRAGLRFGLVYEDQTVTQLIKGGKFRAEDAVTEGAKLMGWVDRTWFHDPAYLRFDGKPLFLVFGPQYYKSDDWTKMFAGLATKPAFFTLHHRREPAMGAYDWPLPGGGTEGCLKERAAFFDRAKGWPTFISAAYPRFHDFYKEAGIGASYGIVDDLGGKTYESTLTSAIQSGAPFVQLATWNDWGEGTVIEPSVEFGYRDLEATQRLRKRLVSPSFPYTAADLRLPVRLYGLRKRFANDAARRKRLDLASELLLAGRVAAARRIIDRGE